MTTPPSPKANRDRAFAAALLAGGQSRRMGTDKAWLERDGKPLWQIQLGKLQALHPVKLMIACREAQALAPAGGVELVLDPPDNQGPLPAILRCLELAHLPLLVLGVDMPQMTASFLEGMVAAGRQNPGRGVVYESARGFEPLAALYPLEALPLLHRAVAEGNLRLQAFVRNAVEEGLMDARKLEAEAVGCFVNVNRPEDVAAGGAPEQAEA